MYQKLLSTIFVFIVGGLLAACSSTCPEVPCGPCTIAPKKATSRPYCINGIWYYPQAHYEYEEVGMASYYGGGDVFHGRPTATGERFDMNGVTAAHKTLPLPCVAEVTNLQNGRQVVVKVNDRGPFVSGRIIDVSRRVAQLLGFENKGTEKVRVRTLVPESLALNGIDRPTTMMAQSTKAPSSAPVRGGQDPILANQSYPSLPDDLFERALDDLAVSEAPDHSLRLASTPDVPAPVTSQNGIFVQVGEYASQSQATGVTAKLQGFGEALVQSMLSNGPNPYVVRMGPFKSMAQANQALDQLADAGHGIPRIIIAR